MSYQHRLLQDYNVIIIAMLIIKKNKYQGNEAQESSSSLLLLGLQVIFGVGSSRCRWASMFLFFPVFFSLHPLSIHACGQQRARLNPRRRRCDRELVAAFQISSFCLLLFFASRLWSRFEGGRRRRGRHRGVNQPPTSISNSLCSPHASRGSDLTLPRRKANPLQCFTT